MQIKQIYLGSAQNQFRFSEYYFFDLDFPFPSQNNASKISLF